MNNEHPIAPPTELLGRWEEDWHHSKVKHIELEDYIATQAAQWGADQELDACCEWFADARNHGFGHDYARVISTKIRAARRPKPPSLKEQALAALEDDDIDVYLIRRALEALDD